MTDCKGGTDPGFSTFAPHGRVFMRPLDDVSIRGDQKGFPGWSDPGHTVPPVCS